MTEKRLRKSKLPQKAERWVNWLFRQTRCLIIKKLFFRISRLQGLQTEFLFRIPILQTESFTAFTAVIKNLWRSRHAPAADSELKKALCHRGDMRENI